MKDNKKIIIAIVVGVALLLTVGIGSFVAFGGGAGKQRSNTLTLAKEYVDRGEYQRALDLLDKLLIADASDKEARALRDSAIEAKRKAEGDRSAAEEAARKGGEKSMNTALDKIGRAVESASKVASQSPQAAAKAAEEANRRAQAEDARRRAADEEKAKAEAAAARKAEELAAQKAALEAEAARKKAQAEELARKSKEVQDRMRIVNDLVTQGKKAINEGKYGDADKTFTEAISRVPDGENRFQAQKLAEIADSYYDGFKRDPNGKEGQESLKNAIKHARDAIKADPGQALPHFTLGKINGDLKQWDNAISEFKESTRLDPKNYLYSFELGRAYFNARKFADARQAFEASAAMKSDFEAAWYNLGGTLRVLGKRDEALAAYRKAVGAKPDY
ncbi:MAG: tetratricopeptide repeat protein, partial [Treponemataceae bacterium]